MAASQPSPGTSSASQNATAGARAPAMPALSANGLPRAAAASTTRIGVSGCASATARNSATEPSVEPLSARTISQGRSQRCAASPSRVSRSVPAPFRQAMTTLRAGIGSVMALSDTLRGICGRWPDTAAGGRGRAVAADGAGDGRFPVTLAPPAVPRECRGEARRKADRP